MPVIGFDWHPSTGELWGIDNGADTKGDSWPPEEVNRIVQDGNYGIRSLMANVRLIKPVTTRQR
jgi:hypothetical protein